MVRDRSSEVGVGKGGGGIGPLLNQAMDRHRVGDLAGAEGLYRRVLALDPMQADALNLCGVACHQQGRSDEGRVLLERALALRPNDVATLENLGLLLVERFLPDEAAPLLRRAVRLAPRSVAAWMSLAMAHRQAGDMANAEAAYRTLLSLAPDNVGAMLNFSDVLRLTGRAPAAETLMRRALALQPNSVQARVNLGLALQWQGNLSSAQVELSRAVDLAPGDPVAHWNRALVRLALGDLAGGWPDYKYRFGSGTVNARRDPRGPVWGGDALRGRRLMIWREQGLGDEFMFSPLYAPALRAALSGGGSVVFDVEPRLVGLMSRYVARVAAGLPGLAEVRAERLNAADFDVHLPAGDLPGLFAATLSGFAEGGQWGRQCRMADGGSASRRRLAATAGGFGAGPEGGRVLDLRPSGA